VNSVSFLLAAIGFVIVSVFVFMNYPLAWRKDKLFVTILALWHLLGTSCLICVFVFFRSIPLENVRYEICRIATFFNVSTMLLGLLFLIRLIYSRAWHFLLRRTGRKAVARKPWIADRRNQTVFFILLSFAICIAGYFNVDILHLHRYDVNVTAKSADSELRICLIADIHAGSGTWEYTYDDMAKQIDACDADVLLIGGDLCDETTAERDLKNFISVLKEIKQPRYGIYYIYGNHDDLVENWAADVRPLFGELGVRILTDEMVILGEDIQLIGRLDPSLGAEKIADLFKRLNPDPNKPILVLTHRPKHLRELASLGCDLVMAGHTHGFNIPQFLGVSPVNDMISGIRHYGDMTAVTTSGTGAWGFHYKWPAESEVVCITVHFCSQEVEKQ
jgi:hypothetical protein